MNLQPEYQKGERVETPPISMNKNNSTDTVKTEFSHEEKLFVWPLSHMKKEHFKKGDVLFKMGDTADKMYYVQKGLIRLVEMNIIVKHGDVIGEIGILSPFAQRTASATCEEDLEVFTMGKSEVLDFLSHNPSLAFRLIQLSIARFIENVQREAQARERIESELRIAADIQRGMLPRKFPPFPERTEFAIFAMMDPAKEVGGDFYDFFLIDKTRLCFVIGDVSGKGVPAALFMAIAKTVLKSEALRGLPAEDILNNLNNILCPDNETGMFVTIFCAILNLETGELQFSNGGHNPPLVCGSDRCDFIRLRKGFALGAREDIKCSGAKLILKPNDIIFLYTDGVTEAMNPQNELFSEERLKNCLANLQLQNKDVTEITKGVRKEITDFTQGAPQSDDITMLTLIYKGTS